MENIEKILFLVVFWGSLTTEKSDIKKAGLKEARL
jgi:hypothetical protein